jgi:4-hydroxybenzoyl-CoA reductase alpha subunit
MKKYSVIGTAVPQVDSDKKVTGKITFIDDVELPGMLYGAILRSPYAHAKIIDIDTRKAEKLFGVRAVITSRNTKMVKYGFTPFDPADEYAMAVDKVRYVGDVVAAVAAVDEDTAEEALELIEVKYEELPAVFNQEDAMKPGAPKIHDSAENNIAYRVSHVFGDVEKGFAESHYIREDRFETPMQSNAFLGTQGSVASFNPATGNLTIYEDAQMVYTFRPLLARIFGIQANKLNIIRPYLGGGFGAKSGAAIDAALCAGFLTMRTGRPVKIIHSREEEFGNTRGREPLITYFKTGAKKDGTLVAMECKHISNAGAYFDMSGVDCRQDVGIFDLVLRCPNVKYEGYVVYTNTIPSGSFRGLTNNAFTFGQHCHMDMLARDLGMDVTDLYLKNARQKGDVTTAKYRLDSCGISECIHRVVETSGWKDKRGKLPKNRGIGFAMASHTCGSTGSSPGAFDISEMIVKVDDQGDVRVLSGRGETGQGATTMIVMCVAEELGLALGDISINELTDTDIIPFDRGNYASRGTILQGNAAVAAAQDVKQQLFEVVANKLEVNVDDLEAKNGRIFAKGVPGKGMTFKEAVKTYEASGRRLPLIGRGHHIPPTETTDMKTGEGNLSAAYGLGARVVEVEVDTETGQVKILSTVAADDCGKVINPLILNGQAQGGLLQNIGMALFEGIQYDEKGKVVNASFSDYRFPTVWQSPTNSKQIWVETIDPHGPYGAKGIAEVVALGWAPAIANAIYDAIGIRFRELPISPEKILNALKETGGI